MACGGGATLAQTAHAPTIDALRRIIVSSGCRSVAVIGLVKNAGKTTVVNALLASGSSRFGLTSLGLDGERIDHLTGLAKPSVTPPAGTLVATTLGSLDRSGYRLDVVEELPYLTPLGRVVIGRAGGGGGTVEVSGPTTLAELSGTIARLRANGAARILVDGAINRLGSASPRVSDGVVVATGGMVADDIDEVVDVTSDTLDMLLLPEVSAATRTLVTPHLSADARVVCIDGHGVATPLQLPTVVGEGVAVARAVERLATATLCLGGAFTREFADDLARVLPPRRRLRMVVRDATVLVLPPGVLRRLGRRGITVEVLTPLRVLAVTANPFRTPQPYPPKLFFAAVVKGIGTRVPVFDVVHGLAALPSASASAADSATPLTDEGG